METQTTDKNSTKDKYSSLLMMPASLLKKFAFNSKSNKTDQEYESDNYNGLGSKNIESISQILIELINNTQKLFLDNEAFDSVKRLAHGITNASEANHVLLVFTGVINSLSDKYILNKQDVIFAVPGEIIDKFKFPDDYKAQSMQLKDQCDNIQSPLELKTSIQSVFELINFVYTDSVDQKKELEAFLFNVGMQISRIGDELHSAVEKQTSDLNIQNELNAQMNNAVNDISKNVSSANDLDALKVTVKSQLDSLQHLVEEERNVVKAHETRIKESVHVLANKVDQLKMEAQELREKVKKEKENALRDPLTGLFNREAYDNRINSLITDSKANQKYASLLIWDVDHFKKFNDTYGHVIGDRVLKAVAKKLNNSLTSNYFLARYGGEEFVMILPGVTAGKAIYFADKIREEISRVTFLFKGKPIKITISCGIADIHAKDNAECLFERADKALYEAKKRGRNCVVVSKNTSST